MITVESGPRKSRHPQQRLQSRIPGNSSLFEPFADKDPVLFAKGHDVAYRREAGKGKKISFQLAVFRSGCPSINPVGKKHTELVGDHRAADIREGIGFRPGHLRRDLGVDHCLRRRDDPGSCSVRPDLEGNFVVICHNDSHPQFPCGPQRIRGRDPVITCQDRIHAMICRIADQPLIDAVSVREALRKHSVRMASELTERVPQNIGRADPVHIIVANDPDPFAFPDLARKDFHRFFRIRKKTRVVKILQSALQKAHCTIRADHIPVADQSGQDRGDPAFLRYPVKIRPLGGHDPLILSQTTCTSLDLFL